MSFSTDKIDWSAWESFNSTVDFELPLGDAEKILYYRIRDYAGNIGEPINDKIILDTTPPEIISFHINGNAKYTNSRDVQLTTKSVDELSGINSITYSFDGEEWLPWEIFKSRRNFILKHGDGEKIVYCRLKDNADNVAKSVYDTITLDTLPPHSLMVMINNGAGETNESIVTLNFNAVDDTSRLHAFSTSNDGTVWSSWENFTYVKYYNLAPGDGAKIVYFKVMDSAGNIADPVSATIVKSSPAQESTGRPAQGTTTGLEFWILILMIIIIMLLLSILALIMKRRKTPYQDLLSNAVTLKPGAMETLNAIVQMAQTSPQLAAGTASKTSIPILVKSAAVPADTAALPALPPARFDGDKSETSTSESTEPKVTPKPTIAVPVQAQNHSQTPTPSPLATTTQTEVPEVHLPESTSATESSVPPKPTVEPAVATPAPTVATPTPTVASQQPTPTVATPTPTIATPTPTLATQSHPDAKPTIRSQEPQNEETKKVRIKDIL
jgi:hypothetical protein